MTAAKNQILAVLRRQAALMETFNAPELVRQVLKELGKPTDTLAQAQQLARLREDCTVQDGESGRWQLRPSVRRKVLEQIASDGELPASVASLHFSPLLVDAFRGQGSFTRDELTRQILNVDKPQMLESLLIALDRTGKAALGFEFLPALRSKLTATVEAADQPPFFGRAHELEVLHNFVSDPQGKPPVRVLFISGLPGIGKSHLLAQLRQDVNKIVLRLDFDRGGLSLMDPLSLALDLSRQIGNALPDAAETLGAARRHAASASIVSDRAETSPRMPRQILSAMADALAQAGRPVVLMLDSLEALRAQGETHPARLFNLLDDSVRAGFGPLAVVAAGRRDALAKVRDRIALELPLDVLDSDAIRSLLDGHGIDRADQSVLIDRCGGNPLRLRLAARALNSGMDTQALDRKLTTGWLYRAVLSRVDPPLSALVQPGLVLRRVSTEALRDVVAPAAGQDLSVEQTKEAFDQLCSQHWLVFPDGGDWVRHRPDLRREVLPAVYADMPETAAAVDEKAAEWFAPTDSVSALYHRLQLVRSGAPLPSISSDLASAFSIDMLDDLPPAVADAVRHARGERSDFSRSAPPGSANKVDSRAIVDLRNMIERGDLPEAQQLVGMLTGPGKPPSPEAALPLFAYHWLIGSRAQARRNVMEGGQDRFDALLNCSTRPREPGDAMIMLAWAEHRCERDFDGVRAKLRDEKLRHRLTEMRLATAGLISEGGPLDLALHLAWSDAGNALTDNLTASLLEPSETLPANLLRQEEFQRLRWLDPKHASLMAPRSDVDLRARLNPYARVLSNHVRLSAGPSLSRWLKRLHYGLPELARLYDLAPPDVLGELGAPLNPTDLPDLLAALGLAADWAAGFAFFHRVSDLPALARAAERWRASVAGDWRYGRRPPPGFDQKYDAGLADWPITDPQAALQFWVAPDLGAGEVLSADDEMRLLTRLSAPPPSLPRVLAAPFAAVATPLPLSD